MTDIIGALQSKRRRLAEEKKRIEINSTQEINRLKGEIARIDEAIATLNNAVQEYLCPCCKGTGTVRHCDAAGDMEDVTCSKCHGTGVAEVKDG